MAVNRMWLESPMKNRQYLLTENENENDYTRRTE